MSKVLVLHARYGCDTGCCGHFIEVDGKQRGGSFRFEHPGADTEDERKKWAEELVKDALGKEHVKDLDWENCVVVDC